MLQFRRITTQKRFIPQIDGLRFVAIASVVFFHIYAPLERGAVPVPVPLNIDMPKHGVELFFAISWHTARSATWLRTHLHYCILYYCPFFLAGFLLCDLYLTRGEWRPSFLWDAAICLWPFVWRMGRNVGHVVLPFLIGVLYLSAFRGRISSAIFSHPLITNMGGMCYSIYLFHFMIIYGVKHLTASLHFGENFWFHYVLQSRLILPVVMLFCGIFFVLIERPCMDREWPKKLWHHAQTFVFSRSEQRNLEKLSIAGFAHSPLISEVHPFS